MDGVSLKVASREDMQTIWKMQIDAFSEYSDYMELDADIRAKTVQMDCVEGAEGDELLASI